MTEVWYKMKKIIADKKMFYIAYNKDKSTIHAGKVLEGNQIVTAQPIIEKFYDETNWKNRATDLGYEFPVDEEDLA